MFDGAVVTSQFGQGPGGDVRTGARRRLERGRSEHGRGPWGPAQSADSRVQQTPKVPDRARPALTGRASATVDALTTIFARRTLAMLGLEPHGAQADVFEEAAITGLHLIPGDGVIEMRWNFRGRHVGSLAGELPTGGRVSIPVVVTVRFDGRRIADDGLAVRFDAEGALAQVGGKAPFAGRLPRDLGEP